MQTTTQREAPAKAHPAYARSEPDWKAVAYSGLAAGTAAMAFQVIFGGSQGGWEPFRTVASLSYDRGVIDALGPSRMLPTIVIAALAYAAALSIEYAAVLSQLIYRKARSEALLTGIVFGLLLYFVNFYLLSAFFPWFAEARGWPTLWSHLVFGVIATAAYLKLERR